MLDDERWAQAKEWFGATLLGKVRNLSLNPAWTGDGDRFSAVVQDGDTVGHVIVDAATAIAESAFDHEAVAKGLAELGISDVTASSLALTSLTVDGEVRRFAVGGQHFECLADGSRLERKPAPDLQLALSPDGSCGVFARGHNLWLRDLTTGAERRLTTDGVEHFDYGAGGSDLGEVARRRAGTQRPIAGVLWSPDAKYVLALRTDRRSLPDRPLIKEFFPPDQHYAVVTDARFEVAGHYERAPRRLTVTDVESGSTVSADVDGEQLQDFAGMFFSTGCVWWDAGLEKVYIVIANRRGDTYGLAEIVLATGESRVVYEESQDFYYTFNEHDYNRPNFKVLAERNEFIWYSQRSGWGHLYAHDLTTGDVKRPLTTGEWVVRDLIHVDGDWVYFLGAGREAGRNPYYRHLYRVPLTGGEPELLTPEDADHRFECMSIPLMGGPVPPASMSPSGRYFVDNYSTLTEPPVTVIRRSDGTLVGELARADISALTDMGWQPPRPMKTLAGDGVTELFGAMFAPRDFDPTRSYAVIDMTYPGPQAPFAPVSFVDGFRTAALRDAQMFADFGFVVVAFDGRGCSGRDKKFRYAFAGTEDVFGSADDVAAIRHLAAVHPFVDATRVGITGGSYGGYGSTRAILLHPDFFRAAVATVGPADYRSMQSSISVERFFLNSDDRAESEAFFDLTSNARLADRLEGHLMLIYGEIDENVPLNQSFRMFAALQDADKTYDTIMLTNQPHAGGGGPYAVRQTVRYFLEHLGGPQAG